jgi:glycosyltransferase involved in cell wall biosynthesis
MENMLVSVLIANYNKKKYIKRCLNSLELQTYKNFEVIFFDDKSKDNSVSEVKKFFNKLNIKLIINKKKKFNITAYDQINSYFFASKYAKGKLILFLDSDDFFDKDKIKKIVSYFNLNKNKKIVFDLPKLYFSEKKIKFFKLYKRTTIASMWPRFTPQSCISIRTIFFRKISSKLLYKKFPKLVELYQKIFGVTPKNLHNSLNDVIVCLRCFIKLKYEIFILIIIFNEYHNIEHASSDKRSIKYKRIYFRKRFKSIYLGKQSGT